MLSDNCQGSEIHQEIVMLVNVNVAHARVVSNHSQATLETYSVHTNVLGIHVTMLSIFAHIPRSASFV